MSEVPQEPESVTITIHMRTGTTTVKHARRRVGSGKILEPMSMVITRAVRDARSWVRRNGHDHFGP